jgi:hypothetical protein
MHHWGIAMKHYAAEYRNYLPENIRGALYWSSGDFRRRFIDKYLLPVGDSYEDNPFPQGPEENEGWTDKNNIAYCPTQEYMRWCEKNSGSEYGGFHVLIGYYYLCGQKGPPYESGDQITFGPPWDIEPDGWTEGRKWLERKKFDTRYRNAPVLSDIKLYDGTSWFFGNNMAYSSHTKGSDDGEPDGGNFLFEDGHAEWFESFDIKLGCYLGATEFYWRVIY